MVSAQRNKIGLPSFLLSHSNPLSKSMNHFGVLLILSKDKKEQVLRCVFLHPKVTSEIGFSVFSDFTPQPHKSLADSMVLPPLQGLNLLFLGGDSAPKAYKKSK